MTRFRWINRWISADMTTFHVVLGLVLLVCYLLGVFLAMDRLTAIGLWGGMILILIHLFHLQLHSCDKFLAAQDRQDRLPKEQMKLVNRIFMAIYLAVTGLAMAAVSLIPTGAVTEALKWLLLRAAVFLAALFPDGDETGGSVSQPAASFLPPQGWGSVKDPSLLTDILNALGFFLGAVLTILLAGYGLYQIYRMICRFFSAGIQDGDEKVFLRPEFVTESYRRKKGRTKPLWRDFSINGKIRRAYRKKLISCAGQKKFPESGSPKELEEYAGVGRERFVYHEIYEKARYSGQECKKVDMQQLITAEKKGEQK